MSPIYPDDLPKEELAELFPLERPRIRENTFEIGLVLAGTVSAGAYTAGVLDYIIEALDSWTRAKEQRSPDAPKHEVVISTIAGASGGAINGAILTRAAGWSFQHGSDRDNPFYSTWAHGVDLSDLLSTQVEPGIDGFASLFNCKAIEKKTAAAIAYQGEELGAGASPAQRSYLANPLRLFMMVNNVTGVPYTIPMTGESKLGRDFLAHADFMRFALAVDGGVPNCPMSRPDEIVLRSCATENWDRLGAAALATSAFPFAFRARPLTRALRTAAYRVVVIPAESGAPEIKQLIPNWERLVEDADPSVVNFVAVDGGTINNEPLDVVRTALAGLNGRNKRQGTEADRAVLMIDPFSDPDTLGPRQPPGVLNLLMPFITSLIYQARFRPEDIALAENNDVFSRFLIAPFGFGPGKSPFSGKAALASGGLGGFIGYVDRSFQHYDYMLGRRNAYEFLKDDFAFPANHHLFNDGNWTDDQRSAQRASPNGSGTEYLRMIPLMPELTENPPPLMTAATWPKLSELPNALAEKIAERLDAVYQLVFAENVPLSWWKRMIISAYACLGWKLMLRGALRNAALDTIIESLRKQELL